jgi:two-component system response regulator NreC
LSLRILIADDHGVLRAGLRALLSDEPDMEVVGEAVNGDEALRLAEELKPDVVLMDLSMPDCGGIQATQSITERLPDTSVLILTVHEDNGILREAIQRGAAGYILKRAVESELINAIRSAACGELYIHPAMTRALLTNEPSAVIRDERAVETLTGREYEVLRMVAQGYTNRQIASRLTISVRTVESHRANLMDKLDLHSRVELVRYAVQHGFFEDEKGDSELLTSG